MSRRQVNRGVVYTGKVGVKMRPSRAGLFSTRRVNKRPVKLNGGPLGGARVWLECSGLLDSFSSTLPIICRGQAGRYVSGKWESSHA